MANWLLAKHAHPRGQGMEKGTISLSTSQVSSDHWISVSSGQLLLSESHIINPTA